MNQSEENYLAHLRALSPEEVRSELHEKISQQTHDLDNTDAVSSEIAMTNASGFGVDELEVDEIDLTGAEARVTFTFTMSGDQDADKPWSGTTIIGDGVAVIDDEGSVTFADVSAERDMDEFGDDQAE